MTKEQLIEASKNIDVEQDKVRESAYNKICQEVMDSDIESTAVKSIIVWALTKHFDIELDVFETQEKWI